MIFIFLSTFMRCKRVISEDTMVLLFFFGFFELIAVDTVLLLLASGALK